MTEQVLGKEEELLKNRKTFLALAEYFNTMARRVRYGKMTVKEIDYNLERGAEPDPIAEMKHPGARCFKPGKITTVTIHTLLEDGRKRG